MKLVYTVNGVTILSKVAAALSRHIWQRILFSPSIVFNQIHGCSSSRQLRGFVMATIMGFGAVNCYSAPVSVDFIGMHIHRANSSTPWPKARFGSWRLWDASVQWVELQPSVTTWDFGRLDSYVELARRNSVSILLPLGLSPTWASARPAERSAYGEGAAAEPASIADWKVYVETVAYRYKGKISAYEIWNEPNDSAFYTGTIPALVKLTCEAYKILKTADPSNVIVGPAYVGEQNIGKLEEFLALGGSQCIDIVSFHFYEPTKPPEAIIPLIEKVKNAMRRQDVDHLPLWNTEAGWLIENTDGTTAKWPDKWPVISNEQSAAFVARAYLLNSAFGVQRFYWYAWDNGAMGLIEPQTKMIKPGGIALSIVAEWLIGNPPPKCISRPMLWICTIFVTPAERRIVVWSPTVLGWYLIPDGWVLTRLERADGKTESITMGSRRVSTDGVPRQIILRPKAPS